MTNKLADWTPAIINRVANENGWDSREYDKGHLIVFTQTTKLAVYEVLVHYTRRGGVFYAALHVRDHGVPLHRADRITMLEGNVSGKREAVTRWLAGDFDFASEYRC